MPWAGLLRPLRGEFSWTLRLQTPAFDHHRLKSVRMGSSEASPTNGSQWVNLLWAITLGRVLVVTSPANGDIMEVASVSIPRQESKEYLHDAPQNDSSMARCLGRLLAGNRRLGRAYRAAALRSARTAARRRRGAAAFGRAPRRLARSPRRDQCQEPPAHGRHRAAPGGLSQEAGLPSVDRRARGQVDARRHAGLGLHGRPGPARETRPRRRGPDPLPGTRRLPRHLRAGQRFGLFEGADWDVWSHKYNLLGLLTYYQYTGNEAALAACRKMGDLLIATFPAKKSILAAGTHLGMAATSVLEPIVLLYRATGDERYLQFARYIVKSWDEPNGPKIIATLLTQKQVNKTANGKAYEMLSNLVGLCELARATGDRALLEPVLNAWQDIVDKRLYLTGSASAGECFQADFVLPNGVNSNICETCVTVTWIQLNLQLLRLTGEARFGDELERTFYNHLAAAQHPQGNDWCLLHGPGGPQALRQGDHLLPLQRPPRHGPGPAGRLSARPRRGARRAAGEHAWRVSHATLELGGQAVTVRQQSGFPRSGESVLTLRLARPATFALRVRVPAWASPADPPGRRRQPDFAGRLGNACRPGSGKTATGSRSGLRSVRGSCRASTAMRAGPRPPGDRSCWPATSSRTRLCRRCARWGLSRRSRYGRSKRIAS